MPLCRLDALGIWSWISKATDKPASVSERGIVFLKALQRSSSSGAAQHCWVASALKPKSKKNINSLLSSYSLRGKKRILKMIMNMEKLFKEYFNLQTGNTFSHLRHDKDQKKSNLVPADKVTLHSCGAPNSESVGPQTFRPSKKYWTRNKKYVNQVRVDLFWVLFFVIFF